MTSVLHPLIGANKPMSPRDRRRQFTRTDAQGRIILPPLAHPYAIVVPWIGEKETKKKVDQINHQIDELTSPEGTALPGSGAQRRNLQQQIETLMRPLQIHELSRELLNIDPNDPNLPVGSGNVPTRAAQIRNELEKLLKPYGKEDASIYKSGRRPAGKKFFSETSYLEVKWRKGLGLDQDDQDVSDSHTFKTGRSHFAIVRGGRRWEQAVGGNTLAMSIRNQFRTYAHLNNRKLELNGFVGTSQYLVEFEHEGRKLRILIAPHMRQPKDPQKIKELKGKVDLVVTTNHSWDQFPCAIVRGQSSLGVDAEQYAQEIAKGNLGFGQAHGYFVHTNQRKRDRPVFRDDQGRAPLIELIDGLIDGKKVIVEGTLGVGKDVLPTDRNFIIVDSDHLGEVRELIKRDAYLIDRINLLQDFNDENEGLTAVLDAANGGESRFGLGGYLYPTVDRTQIGGIEWTPDIPGHKVVINPSSWYLNSANFNGQTGKTFDPNMWKETTVVFYSTDISRARREKEGFERWIERYKKEVDPKFDPASIGLKVETPTQSVAVAKTKMKKALFQSEIEFGIEPLIELETPAQAWNYETNMGRWEGGGYVDDTLPLVFDSRGLS